MLDKLTDAVVLLFVFFGNGNEINGMGENGNNRCYSRSPLTQSVQSQSSQVIIGQNWYSNLQCRVKWNNVLGDVFAVLSGVRQGGVLSPALFALYVDDLLFS